MTSARPLELREETEWSRFYWNSANRPDLPRVLLIGDSIVSGYGPVVAKALVPSACVDFYATSRGIDDPCYFRELDHALGEYPYRAIHFNNGLHGWHLSGDAYARGMRRLAERLLRELPAPMLVWASSTPVARVGDPASPDPDKEPRVEERNRRARAVMEELGIAGHDLHGLVKARPELRVDDGYHYNADGQAVQGASVARVLGGRLAGRA